VQQQLACASMCIALLTVGVVATRIPYLQHLFNYLCGSCAVAAAAALQPHNQDSLSF
jgi:hypothetical protein